MTLYVYIVNKLLFTRRFTPHKIIPIINVFFCIPFKVKMLDVNTGIYKKNTMELTPLCFWTGTMVEHWTYYGT